MIPDLWCFVHIECMIVNLQEIRKGMSGLRDGLGKIKQELTNHLADAGEDDRYGRQMLAFYQRAKQQLEDLEDDVKNAESTFTDAINYYGEDDKNMSSSEFYGIFKTFVTSYKVKTLRNLACKHVAKPVTPEMQERKSDLGAGEYGQAKAEESSGREKQPNQECRDVYSR